jgi:hypothetical protein
MSSPPGSSTERSLYPAITDLIKQIGENFGIKIARATEVRIREELPDIMLRIDSHDLIIQVKINSITKMIDDLVKTYPIVAAKGAGLLLLLFSPETRRIHPFEIDRVAPKLRVKRALLLTSWASKHVEETELENVLRLTFETLREYKKVEKPFVDYTTIALIAREAIEELAGAMRYHIATTPKLLNQAQAIIGNFDFYRAQLSDFIENEEVMNTYIADIVAYIAILCLLFLHATSIKRHGRSLLPQIDNPLSPPQALFDIIRKGVMESQLHKDYRFVTEPFLHILEMFKDVAELTRPALARYLYAIQVLRPEHVKEELLGRIYQEGLPPETRKNLGAFFTNPIAARLLAYLAIDNWDEKVLDPACGSGTLLASAYEIKMEKALTRGLSRREAHELFLKEHLFGIDIMQFAQQLSSINLLLQEVGVSVRPNIFWGDGIEKVLTAIPNPKDDPPQQPPLYVWLKEGMDEYSKLQLEREGYDLVIMNPPFTRRERIPVNERKRLDKLLGEIVRGKVGYWAYFFVAADNVIKLGGKLASVTPEEFFAGRSAESVRRYLFKGEVMKDSRWIKTSSRIYMPCVIVKSNVDVAFSEGALYKDYLVVFRKVHEKKLKDDRCIIVILKKKLDELKGAEKDIAIQVRGLLEKGRATISTESFDAMVLEEISSFTKEFVDNMKPLVAFNTIKGFEFYRNLFNMKGLKRLDEVALLRDYTAQYTGKGFEEYVRRLFIARYETRAPLTTFEFVSESNNLVKLRIKSKKEEILLEVPKSALVHSLRTYAGVKRLDITGEEEYAIVNPKVIREEHLKLGGLIDDKRLDKASMDIKKAYDEVAGHALLVRRAQLTSPNVYWLAFYSDNKIIGPSSPMICMKLKSESPEYYKAMVLYLNSSLAFLQLLAYLAITRGSWVTLHSDQVWSKVRVPDLTSLPRDVLKEVVETFDNIAKTSLNLQPLYLRYTSKSELQRKIDKVAFKMIGLSWSDDQLNTLYDVIKSELDIMQHILEESGKRGKAKREKRDEDEDEEEPTSRQKSLTEWIEK